MLFAEREFELSKKNIPKDKLIETLKMEWSLYSGNPIEYYTNVFIIEHLIKTIMRYCKQIDSIKTIQRCIIESEFNLLGNWTDKKDPDYIVETLMTCLAITEVKYFKDKINQLGD